MPPEKQEILSTLREIVAEMERNRFNIDACVVIWREERPSPMGGIAHTTNIRPIRHAIHTWLGLIEHAKGILIRGTQMISP